MTERAESFSAWTDEKGWYGDAALSRGFSELAPEDSGDPYHFPVVVTPLLPDDPKPGETWTWASFGEVEIVVEPRMMGKLTRVVVDRHGAFFVAPLSDLRRTGRRATDPRHNQG